MGRKEESKVYPCDLLVPKCSGEFNLVWLSKYKARKRLNRMGFDQAVFFSLLYPRIESEWLFEQMAFCFQFFLLFWRGKGGTVLKNSNLLSYFQMCIIWGLFNSSLSSFYAQSSSSKENQQWLQLFFFFFLKKRIRLFLKRKHIEGRLSFIMHFSVSTACDSKE